MKHIKYLLIVILLANTYFSISQTTKTDANIFGHVLDKEPKEHIPFVNIIVKNTKIGTATDGTGHYKLSNLKEGKQIVVFQSVGYKLKEVEVEMEKSKSIELNIELSKDALNLEQVVVTGTRTEHFLKDVPIRTEVITAKALESKNASNLYQALEGTPGIRTENQCSFCNFTMIRMQGLGAEHTQMLINGQPMYSGLAGVYGLQQLSTVDIDKIEVVKGAGSALYGSGAIAGAINIVTKEPSFVPMTSIDVQFGSYKTNKYDISSSLRNSKGNIGATIFAQRYTEGIIDQTGAGMDREEVYKKDGISDRVATNLTNAGFGLFIENPFFLDDKLTIRGKSVFENREGGTITNDYYKNPFTDGTENIVTNRYESDMTYNKRIGCSSEINFSAGFVNHKRNATNDSFLNDYMETHGDSVPDLRIMRPYVADENSFTSTLSYSTRLKSHNLIVGVQAFLDELEESGMYVVVDTTSAFYGQPYKSKSNKNAREFGLFIQDEWQLSKKFMIVPGIRFDNHYSSETYLAEEKVFENETFPKAEFEKPIAVNPRLAVKYSINDKFTVRFNTGTGFRAPYGFSEDLHLCSGSPRVWKSSDLKPETSISFNLSGDYYGEKVRVSTNIFQTNLKDKIGFKDADAKVSALGYNYQWDNIGNAVVRGVELSVVTNLMKNLDLGIDFTINEGKYNKAREDWIGTEFENVSKYISRFPQTTGNLKIDYSPKSWIFTLSTSYQGNMYIDYYNEDVDESVGDMSKIKKTDPFLLCNARVTKKFKNFKLYANVNNIFNYVQPERHLDDAAFMYAPVYGTMFSGGITIDIKH